MPLSLFHPPPPTLEAQSAPARPTGLSATAGDHRVTLSWNDPGDSSITRYEYQVNHNATGTGNLTGWSRWADIPGSDASTISHAFTGLTNGKEYRYKIRAVSGNVESKPAPGAKPWYVSATPKGAEPPPVSQFWAERVCDHHFRVRWKRVSGATGYDLNLSRDNRKSWHRMMTNKNHNAWQFSQWSKDRTYWFAIRAVNANGASAWTDLRSIAPPCPVEGLKAKYETNGDVSVEWNPAKRAESYDVNFSADGGKSWQRMVSNHSATTYGFNRDPQTLPWNPNFLVAVQSRKGNMTSPWRNAPIVRAIIPGSRDSAKDLVLASGNDYPIGIWSNGTTMWVSDDTSPGKFFAYKMSDGSRDSGKDIGYSGGISLVRGMTSDGTTMWVGDFILWQKLHAFNVSNGQRDSGKDITLDPNTYRGAEGLWTDGTTMYVGDQGDDKIYAYTIATGQRDTGKEITLDTEHDRLSGLWSDGTTMWASDYEDDKVYAYKMSDGSRDSAKDYNSLAGGNQASPYGLWSDGATMWIVDSFHDTIYAYHSIAPSGN